jgi:hypothetical protein
MAAQKPPTQDPAAPEVGPNAPQERPLPEGYGIGYQERRINPAMESAQRAAQIDHQRRMQGGTWADMPNGQAFRIPPHIPPAYDEDSKVAKMLAAPHLLLLSPKPAWRTGPRYQWRVNKATGPEQQRVANETHRDIRAGSVRKVARIECDPQSPFALYDSYSALDVDVTYDSLILVEIMDERLTYQRYKHPEDKAIRNVVDLPQTVASEKGTSVGPYATGLKQMEVRQGG